MSEMPRFVTVTGWQHVRRTGKYPFSYRLELDDKWITEPDSLPVRNDDKYDELIGKKFSRLEIIMRFGDRFELIDEREKGFDR